MNRRRFIKATASTAALAATSRGNAFVANSQLGANTGPVTVPLLTEDYQVIQRNKDDKGVCGIRIPDDQKETGSFQIRVVDEAERIWMDEKFKPQESGAGGKHILIENIPTGGPYTIRCV